MEQIKTFLESKINKDFDYNWEHYENGNYDDSFQYGLESGEQYAYIEILEKLNELENK